MRNLAIFTFFTLVIASAFAQSDNQSYQQQADQAQLRQLQSELDLQRMQAETDKMQRNTERMMDESKQRRKTEYEELLKLIQPPSDDAKAAKKAADAADDLRDEISRSSTRTVDHRFMAFALILPILFAAYIARRAKKDGIMKYEQKFGVILILCATLFGMLAIMMSVHWFPNSDILQNIQLNLRIQLFGGDEYPVDYLIDIATKYVLLFLTLIAAYGFTSYLGITPVWRKSVKIVWPNNSEKNS